MTPDKYIPIIISGFSFILASLAFWWTRKYNTSDFKLSQKVKDDTLELLSTLRVLHIKAIHTTQGIKDLTILKEKDKINNFLLTPTAFAYSVWVGQKSKETGEKPEKWRIFFLRLTQILSGDNIFSNGCIAAELEELFDTLTDKDFKVITGYLQNIPDALQKLKTFRQYDVAIQAFMDVCKKQREKTTGGSDDILERKFKYLKSRGIKD